MKRWIVTIVIVLMFVLGIFFFYSLLATGEDTTKSEETLEKEVYVSEVLLRAPWAEKNLVYNGEESPAGEFGLHAIIFPDSLRGKLPDPPLPQGPTAFTVAPNGDIYITDPLNKRIQRFDEGGNFVSIVPNIEGSRYEWGCICVDRNNYVYLLWWKGYTEQVVCKYDQQGQMKMTYPLFNEVRLSGFGNKIHCDEYGRLYFQYFRKSGDRIILSPEEHSRLKSPQMEFSFQIGTEDQVYAPDQQKQTLKRCSAGYEQPQIEFGNQEEVGGGMDVVDLYMWNHDFVDSKGNLYRFVSNKEGITITRWHKP
jgi:hypothetical protein